MANRSYTILFRPRFEAPIRAGTKQQTIRENIRRKIIPGDKLHLRVWSGKPFDSPQLRLGTVFCTTVERVVIDVAPTEKRAQILLPRGIWPCPSPLNRRQTLAFVRADGFSDVADFCDYYADRKTLHVNAYLIRWASINEAIL